MTDPERDMTDEGGPPVPWVEDDDGWAPANPEPETSMSKWEERDPLLDDWDDDWDVVEDCRCDLCVYYPDEEDDDSDTEPGDESESG